MKPARPSNLVPLIDPNHQALTISRQAELLGVSRRSYYYQPVVNEAEKARLKQHLNAVDEIYTKRPYYGTRRIQYELEKSYGICVGLERIRHLMRRLGLEATTTLNRILVSRTRAMRSIRIYYVR